MPQTDNRLTDRALQALDALIRCGTATFGEVRGGGWKIPGCGHVFSLRTIERLVDAGLAAEAAINGKRRLFPTTEAWLTGRDLIASRRQRPFELARRTAIPIELRP